jgi:hypothetical protein
MSFWSCSDNFSLDKVFPASSSPSTKMSLLAFTSGNEYYISVDLVVHHWPRRKF